MALVLGAAITACGTGSERSAEPPAPDKIRAVVMPYLTLMPFYIAQEEGFFAEQNLEVEFIRVARNQEIMTALATGDVDVAGGMLTVNELSLVGRGARVRVVGSLGEIGPDHCPTVAFVARREHLESGAVEDPERIRELVFDLDIMIPLGYFTDALLRPHGLTVADLRTVNLRSPAAMQALSSGEIDVSVEGAPFITIMTANGDAAIWEKAGNLVPGFVGSVLMYGPTLLDERPEVGERLAVALLKAIRQYSAGKTARNLEIVQRGTGMDAEIVAEACWPKLRQDALLDPAVMRSYQEWNVANGLVGRVLEDEELYDFRFLEHAAELLAR